MDDEKSKRITSPAPLGRCFGLKVEMWEEKMIISGADLTCSPRGARAKKARRWHADNGPSDMQRLPLGYSEREALKDGGPRHILAWYARSLAKQSYDVLAHPSFHEYACGVMALPKSTFPCISENAELLLDILEIPQNRGSAGTYRLLARLMAELGWAAVRVRDRTRGGYLEQVRGYCRDAAFV